MIFFSIPQDVQKFCAKFQIDSLHGLKDIIKKIYTNLTECLTQCLNLSLLFF